MINLLDDVCTVSVTITFPTYVSNTWKATADISLTMFYMYNDVFVINKNGHLSWVFTLWLGTLLTCTCMCIYLVVEITSFNLFL